MNKFFVVLLAIFGLMACSHHDDQPAPYPYSHDPGKPAYHHRHVDPNNVPIYSYRVPDGDNNWLWYYIMFSNQGSTTNSYSSSSCPCYTYSSPTKVTSFANTQFTPSSTIPKEMEKAIEKEPPEIAGHESELPAPEQQQITEQMELPLDNTVAEGNAPPPETPAAEASAPASEASASTDGGSSDSSGSSSSE